jgi:class I lanthipeptide synthase
MRTTPRTSHTWIPLLEEPMVTLVRASVERVAERLAQEVHKRPASFSLAEGSAGYALTLAYLSECLDRPDLMTEARIAWDATVEGLSQSSTTPALHAGFCGPAWVAAHLGPRLVGDFDDDSFEDVDSALVAHLETTPWYPNYDLIGGLVGFGVYALERWPDGHSGRILELVVVRLTSLSENVDEGVTWTTPGGMVQRLQQDKAPQGYQNLGLAHGIPGIIAFLALANRAQPLRQDAVHALEGGVEWLLCRQQPHASGLRYPAWQLYGEDRVDVSRDGSRLAWCYGDLGVAAALHVAGECYARGDWSREALELARNCTSVAFTDTGIRDQGICHGTAGVAHLFARMANASGDEALREAARFWLRKTLEMRVAGEGIDGYVTVRAKSLDVERAEDIEFEQLADAGFLSGAAGVALALGASFSSIAPAWDRTLLLSG